MSTSYTEAQFGSFFDLPAGEDLTSWFTHLCEDQVAAFPAPAPAFEAPAPVAMADPRKRSAEYQLAPQGEASGVKRQRSPSSSRENSGGSNDGDHEHSSAAAGGRGGGRRLWVKERDHEWWDRMSSPACPEDEFRRAFRMSRATFEAASGIANVVGAMYTTHIPIIAPKANVAAYYNRRHTERNQKTSYSITVQGVVDAAGAFTDVCIGWPGSMSDADVLDRSALYAQRGAAGRLQGQWVVGGAGYPLMDWLLVPYTHQNMTWAQHVFNERVDGVRAVARDAFQRLKARWGCLQKRTEVKLQDLPVVLGACCVLHNICERAGDAVDPENAFQIFDDDMVAENPVRSQVAVTARDEIAHNLLHRNSAAGPGFLLK
ncbi:putative nuclease HARBI1 [Panicum miliaceum]|uniref:Nuclease HARBI1 n=1 Tax=Panicum miliaceum TaxID=4540 RepID=A0A3L6SKB6_PANMI|nr:putative nuclease HARBI1 [Panicum miliaceum]